MTNNLKKGELNKCLKLTMIRFSFIKAENSLLTLARYFFSIAEPFYNFCFFLYIIFKLSLFSERSINNIIFILSI